MPRIYVACLASYNSGVLHGEWIDCEQDADAIRSDIAAMLRKSMYPNVEVEDPDTGEMVPSAEEWAIHDFEGFGQWRPSEHEDIDALAAYTDAIADLSESETEAFERWVANQNSDDIDWDDATDKFREQYRGCWDTLADYVENYWEECGEYQRDDKNWWSPINYVDWERMANDLQSSGDVWSSWGDHGLHVFDNQ
jgi:antirestriction protein